MLEASLVLCALAGIAAAVGIRRYRHPDTREIGLEVERSILAKCMEHLEQPEYAAERNVLYEKYQSRLEHVNDTLSGKKATSDMSAKEGERKGQRPKGKASASKSGDKKTGAPKENTIADRVQKTTKGPAQSKDAETGKVDTDTAPATEISVKQAKSQKGKIGGQAKKADRVTRNKPAGKDAGATRRPAPKAPVHDTSPKQAIDGVSQTVNRPAAESVDVKDVKSEKVEKGKRDAASKGQGTDNVETQEDLETIKNDIRRALSKLEQVEAD